MSHKIGKYTYENEEVLKEFISKLLAKLAKGKGLRTLAKILLFFCVLVIDYVLVE